MIVVTGATGVAGSQVVRALLARGEQVRVLVRDPERAVALFGESVDVAIGDFLFPQTVQRALEGADRLFLSCADDPRRVGWEKETIRSAAASGVGRIVRLSSIAAAPGSPVAFWDWHGRVDEHLLACGIPAVVLRSSFYMSNLLAAAGAVAHEGRVFAPAGEARIAMIDSRDVGAAAAAALTTPGLEGRMYRLTGARAIGYAEVAEALGRATGRAIEFVDVPPAAAREEMVRSGMPEPVADQLVLMFEQLRGGADARVTTSVADLTGRPARDIAAFARDHVEAFMPVAIGAGR